MALDFRMGDVGLDRPHVIAFNAWQGEDALPPPPDSLGLRYFTIVLPNASELEKVLDRARGAGSATKEIEGGILVWDPSQNAVLLALDKTNAGDS
jgi:catechol 2,3-dioxygenase